MDESKSTLKTKAGLENNGKSNNAELSKKNKTKKSHAPLIILALLMIAFFCTR